MTAIDKLIARFSTLPRDFTWEETVKMLVHFGYYPHNKGATSGSRVRFIMDYLEYKGYRGSVKYSKEDDCLYGKVLGMRRDLILYEGNNIDELRADFVAGIDSYLAGCKADGVEPQRPISISVNIRIPSELHRHIAILAENTGTTIAAIIRKTLEERAWTV